jgi:hypothetical protein
MEPEALRLLILSKLADGKLPLESFPNVWGGPGNGETCDACGAIVTKREFVIAGVSLAGGRKALYLHAGCFRVWEAERRPLYGILRIDEFSHYWPVPGIGRRHGKQAR